jgi:hypothetical protein
MVPSIPSLAWAFIACAASFDQFGVQTVATVQYGTSYYWYFDSVYSYAYDYGCTLCPPEALLSSPVDLVAMHGAHRFLEKFFCHKMKLAGPLQFKKISHCSIDLDHAATLDASFAADSDGTSSSQ